MRYETAPAGTARAIRPGGIIGFFVGFLDQGFNEAVAVADPAGDEIIELVRRHTFIGGPAADP